MSALLKPKPRYIVCDGNEAAAQAVTLAQVDRLRVTFYLDGSVASLVKAGTEVEVRPVEHLGDQGGDRIGARLLLAHEGVDDGAGLDDTVEQALLADALDQAAA